MELAVADIARRLPAGGHDDLRDQLPGLEPERELSDWGRSERVDRLLDRTVYDFLYHYWFRVDVEAIDNVPSEGGALLLANRAGALPADALMIAKAIKAAHPHPRPVQLLASTRLQRVPGLGMLLTKAGAIPPHPANMHRLLFDEGALVLAFPERQASKPLSRRYQLGPFGDAGIVEAALRARAPIVPVAVLGAEEASPVSAWPLRRLPIAPLPLPAKFKIRFLEAIGTDGLAGDPWSDERFVHALTEDIRALIQENVLELVASRRSVWLG